MIKVSVEVHEGADRFKVGVQADSISRAVSIMKRRHPDRDVRVVFPIEPEGFFVGGPKKTQGNGGGSRVRLMPDRVR
jgi:hypothetical protein